MAFVSHLRATGLLVLSSAFWICVSAQCIDRNNDGYCDGRRGSYYSRNRGAIGGGSGAGAFLLLLLMCLFCYCCIFRSRMRKGHHTQTTHVTHAQHPGGAAHASGPYGNGSHSVQMGATGAHTANNGDPYSTYGATPAGGYGANGGTGGGYGGGANGYGGSSEPAMGVPVGGYGGQSASAQGGSHNVPAGAPPPPPGYPGAR